MTRPCEICSGMTLAGQPPLTRQGRMRRVVLDGRIIALCDAHARAIAAEGLDTLEALRVRYGEPGGRRSFVERRCPLDRRILPPRPERRRRGFGRRSTDPIS